MFELAPATRREYGVLDAVLTRLQGPINPKAEDR